MLCVLKLLNFSSKMALTFLLSFSAAQNAVTIINVNGDSDLVENPGGYVAYSKATTVSVSKNSACDCFPLSPLRKLDVQVVYVNWWWGSQSVSNGHHYPQFENCCPNSCSLLLRLPPLHCSYSCAHIQACSHLRKGFIKSSPHQSHIKEMAYRHPCKGAFPSSVIPSDDWLLSSWKAE